MKELVSLLSALVVVLLLLGLAGPGAVALLLQITWPIRRLLHLLRARRAMREFDREYAKLTHPAAQ